MSTQPPVSDLDTFEHLMVVVFKRDDTTLLYRGLTEGGYIDVPSILTMDDHDIDALRDNKKKMLPSDMNLIKLFIQFVRYRQLLNTPIESNDDVMEVTRAEFDRFRINGVVQYHELVAKAAAANAPPQPAPTIAAPAITGGVASNKPIDLFRRGIMQDQSAFPELKNEEDNDAWHQSFETQAHAQDVAKVLDPTFIPATPDEIELFDAQKTYVYAVLESKVLTDRGRAIVREHATDRNAQQAYDKIRKHHTASTKAKMASSDLLTYITSTRLGTTAWRGATEGFITHWQKQVRKYERLCEPTEHFSDGQKMTMLQNAVNPVDQLAAVKQNAELERTKTGVALTYDQYCSLLISAAVVYDQSSARRRDDNRTVATHDQMAAAYERDERLFAYMQDLEDRLG